MTDGQFLHYDGPVAIGGVQYPIGRLREHREPVGDDGHLRSWDGAAWIVAARAPEGFSPNLATDPVPVELPDGRHGNALVTNVTFDGAYWKLELTGTGPAPGASK